jgi:hypothetical protein
LVKVLPKSASTAILTGSSLREVRPLDTLSNRRYHARRRIDDGGPDEGEVFTWPLRSISKH